MEITEDKTRILLHLDAIHAFLSNCYWSKAIPKQTVYSAIDNSLAFAVIENNRLVGFARVISDFTTFAYLADVFVIDEARGRGISKKLVAHIMQHTRLQGLRRFMLATQDAHGLYTKFGFQHVTDASPFMQINHPMIYTETIQAKA
ncbi:Histone acetyltransferase HPA2 and related acetyltransferases [Pseudoalteromonas luteoviolacea B = ATCC 29581]|nr:Histone acetyltransferase HPA2 and related acetyltransferases [Pseudoalteromonas luteoviolacea B = ATCC 29581]